MGCGGPAIAFLLFALSGMNMLTGDDTEAAVFLASGWVVIALDLAVSKIREAR